MMISIDQHPSDRKLRQFAGGICGIALVLAFLRLSGGESERGILTLSLVGLVGLAGLARPRLLRHLFILVSIVTWPVGMLMSFVVLGVIFYAVLTPVGLIRRAMGADPLRLRRRPGSETYWVQKVDRPDMEYYLRQ